MKTMLNIKTNKELKIEAQKTAAELGLPLSIVINQFLKEFVQEKRVVFSSPLIPNIKTQKILDQAMLDIKAGKNLSRPFETITEMDAYLDKL